MKNQETPLTVVADYGDQCGECPLWDSRCNKLLWTDCVGQRFLEYHPDSGRHQVVAEGIEINGFALNAAGGFAVANNRGIWLWDGADRLSALALEVEGVPCRANDCVADAAGRLLVGLWFYDPGKAYRSGYIVRIDTDGTAAIVDGSFHLANGLAFSPDGTTFYSTDSAQRRIYAYSYDVHSGRLSGKRRFIQVPTDEGIPDGLTVDSEGFIWSAQWYGGCVVRYDPDGRVERRVSVPAKQTSSITFGGPEFTDIFITSAALSEPMPIMPTGYDAVSGFFGGPLYHLNLDIPGLPEHHTKFTWPSG